MYNNFTIFFFSSQGISEDGEISDSSEEETSLRRVMLERSKQKYFLCDSSKIGVKKLFTVCRESDLDGIICDTKLPWEKEFSEQRRHQASFSDACATNLNYNFPKRDLI